MPNATTNAVTVETLFAEVRRNAGLHRAGCYSMKEVRAKHAATRAQARAIGCEDELMVMVATVL